ncbi:hypothetical protein JCM10207_000219 [Rhodosporidiobolus poonsookiae]
MEPQRTIGSEDRLSRLPPELLAWIFDLAYYWSQPTGPLSRALLPFDRVKRFSGVNIDSPKNVGRLAAVFRANPTLAPLVKTVRYSSFSWTEDDDPVDDPSAYLSLHQVFSSLSNLSSLDIAGDKTEREITYVLSPAFASNAFPHLSSIRIDFARDSAGAWEPAHFQHLAAFPHLSSLTLTDYSFSRDGVELPPLPRQAPPFVLPHITSLDLWVFHLPDGPKAASSLITACPLLRTLKLATDHCWYLPDVLKEAVCPDIERLVLHIRPPSILGFSPPSPLDHLLPRFSAVKHLHLGYGLYDTTTLLANLAALPVLSSLVFGSDALITLADLSPLVLGPGRLRSLAHLSLQMYELDRGWRLWANGHGQLHPRHEEDEWHLGPGWRVQVDTDQLQPDEVEGFVDEARQLGVKVDGSVVDTAPILYSWSDEVVDCLIAWAHKIGDGHFRDLQEFAGPSFGQIVAERRIAVRWD